MKSNFYLNIILFISIVVITGVVVSWPATNAISAEKDVTPVIDPDDPSSVLYLDTQGNLAGTGDSSVPASKAYQAGQGWHPKALQAAGLPKDKYGLVDWAKLVRNNIIKPMHSLDEDEEEFPPLEVDVIIHAKGDFVNDVTYPHKIHTYWLSCDTCHNTVGGAIFEMAAGTNPISMVEIAEGKWCGRCHGKVAFPLADCNRCHNVKKAKK